ncbi:YwqG family protein [Paenibacillus sp. 7516]|uniref:YwqG family protein n=1 Tax=Paenibacillus sp. 7516 TaxID=2022549 RepID=UPI00201679FC|nr:YwqG family protein [Paenibacillus sp. 7516]
MVNKKEVIRQLEQVGLKEYGNAIANWVFPTAQLFLSPVSDSDIPLGGSKVGGNPDLPEDLEWPTWKEYDMSFISQINLADCPQQLSLPSSGLLSFFYAVKPMYAEMGFYNDPSTCRVFYFDSDGLEKLARRNTPKSLTDLEKVKPNQILFEPQFSVPTSESAYLESLGLGWNGNIENFAKYWKLFLPNWSTKGYINRLMGHPDPIQGDMQVSCELTYGPYKWIENNNPEIRDKVLNSALKWRLLLQIDSEEEKTGMMWGDSGRIYYWIHEDDLANLCFERVICVMQCT